jgi:TRAP-type mannitol/chloroaromatic compound transport system permease large subunit
VPFIAMQFVVLAILMIFPAFALWLPAALSGP